MNAVVVNTEAVAESLINSINSEFNFLFKGITNTYTHYFKHPVNDEWAVVLDMEDVIAMQQAFPDKLKNIDFNVNDIEELSQDWFNEYIIQ